MNKSETIKYLHLDEQEPTNETEVESTYDLTQKQYAAVFTLLDKNESDWVEDSEDIDNSNEDMIESNYHNNDGGSITLIADLEKDKYKITIKDEEE